MSLWKPFGSSEVSAFGQVLHGLQGLLRPGHCRRSIDGTLNKYNKVDSAFKDCLKLTGPLARLQSVLDELTSACLVSFACVTVVSLDVGDFGVVAISGSGTEFFPLMPVGQQQQQAPEQHFSLFSGSRIPVEGSNWSVEDIVHTRTPMFYDCTSKSAGLPQEALWLRRTRMKLVLSLPCIHNGQVVGVLTCGIRSISWNQLLVCKLQDLCCSITPFVLEALELLRPPLASSPCIPKAAGRGALSAVSDAAGTPVQPLHQLHARTRCVLTQRAENSAEAASGLMGEMLSLGRKLNVKLSNGRSSGEGRRSAEQRRSSPPAVESNAGGISSSSAEMSEVEDGMEAFLRTLTQARVVAARSAAGYRSTDQGSSSTSSGSGNINVSSSISTSSGSRGATGSNTQAGSGDLETTNGSGSSSEVILRRNANTTAKAPIWLHRHHALQRPASSTSCSSDGTGENDMVVTLGYAGARGGSVGVAASAAAARRRLLGEEEDETADDGSDLFSLRRLGTSELSLAAAASTPSEDATAQGRLV